MGEFRTITSWLHFKRLPEGKTLLPFRLSINTPYLFSAIFRSGYHQPGEPAGTL